jgi:xanthine permease XanP
VKRPSNVIYAPDERPPRSVLLLFAAQLFMTVVTNLIYPLAVLRYVDASAATTVSVLSLTLLVAAFGTVLQSVRQPLIGSGYLVPTAPTAIYFAPSLVAAKIGGLPLVFAMTVFAGVVEMAVSQLLTRLRAIFPPEVAGTVVFLVGMSIVVVGVRNLVSPTAGQLPDANHWYVAVMTFVVMVGFTIWGSPLLKTSAVLLGIVAGYGLDFVLHSFRLSRAADFSAVPLVGLPGFGHLEYGFDSVVLPAFAVAAIAAALKTVGLITVCQKSTDAEWVRAEMGTISRGVLADGATTSLAGLLGSVGMNPVAASVGLCASTGIHSRIIAYPVAAICVALAVFPSLTLMLALTPIPVIAVTVLVLGSFILVNGLQLIVSRLLDVRRTLVVGLAIAGALLVEVVPTVVDVVPGPIKPFVASSLGLGTLIALAFNFIFRMGTKRRVTLTVQPGSHSPQEVEDFFNTHGAQWGARADVIRKAIFGISQAVEALIENCEVRGPIKIEANFDEFNLNVSISYHGLPLELPDRRPTDKEIIETETGARRLAGYMLRRNADRVSSSCTQNDCVLNFHFVH